LTTTIEAIQNPLYDQKFHQITSDLKQYRINQLKKMEETNSALLVEYLNSRMREGNLKPASRANTIDRLSRLSVFHKNKSFREMTTEDIFSYLDTLRRTECQDPMHRWIGTYNLSLVKIISFFKWLYEPDTHSNNRQIPVILNNIKVLKRKEKTTCCARDLWTNEEDLLFLKYCPDKRLRLYHIMARETSGRPHELLSLKIGDVLFHNTVEGKVYATITIGREGKTVPRTLPIINSIPYLKDWLTSDHPHGDSKNHYLFPSLNRKSIMRNKKLESHSLNVLYSNMRSKAFPRLLEDLNIPSLDKDQIRELLTKPFNPYLRRHIGITEKARQIPEHSLRLYSGWTKTSKMPEVYTHELGNEISNQILELEGYSTKKIESNVLKSRICPNCQEPNKPETKFCAKCRMVLSYDAYTQVMEESETEKQGEIATLRDKLDGMQARVDRLTNLMEWKDQRESRLIDEVYKDYKNRQAK
jgi:integrase